MDAHTRTPVLVLETVQTVISVNVAMSVNCTIREQCAKSSVRMACTATNHLVHMRTIQQRNSDSENRACMDHSASNSGVATHTHLDVVKSASLASGVPTNPVASYTPVQ